MDDTLIDEAPSLFGMKMKRQYDNRRDVIKLTHPTSNCTQCLFCGDTVHFADCQYTEDEYYFHWGKDGNTQWRLHIKCYQSLCAGNTET